MNVFTITSFCVFIGFISAQYNTSCRILNTTTSTHTHEFQIEISDDVNQTKFSRYIRIHNETTKEIVYEIDVIANNNDTIYNNNKTLRFRTPNCNEWHDNTKYYITIHDDDIISSNNSPTTSIVQTSSSSSHANTVTDHSDLTVPTTNTPMMITKTGIFEVYMSSSLNNVTETLKSTTYSRTPIKGESSLPRSAQLGMGLGITFIGLLLIGEILYFKYFYHDDQQHDNYSI